MASGLALEYNEAMSSTRRSPHLLLRREGAVGILTLHRPERANAYDPDMLGLLAEGLVQFESDERVGAIVVEAAGEGAFCGGADLTRLAEARPEDALDLESQRVFDQIARSPLVSVAAVHGAAVAGGFELALACDLRVLGPAARFHLPETALGLIPSAGGCTRLTRLLGPGRAREVILGGRALDAATAVEWGLASRLVKDPRADAIEWATRIATRDRVALKLAKLVIDSDQASVGLAMERLAEALLYARKKRLTDPLPPDGVVPATKPPLRSY